MSVLESATPCASTDQVREQLSQVYRTEYRHAFATLIRLLGEFDLAEEALQEAFAAAVEQWPSEGIPAHPRAWLVSTARFKAIDCVRRQVRWRAMATEIARQTASATSPTEPDDFGEIGDDRLRLIFTCCHPALARESQLALTLREVCGLTTDEVARACLQPTATVAQRIVRAKAKIRDAGIPYVVPQAADLPARIEAVLAVVYLLFNEGYSASSGQSLTRADLSAEAIRLGRLLLELLPHTEIMGLLALLLLQESRRTARATPTGDLILLEHQDRQLWNAAAIAEGRALVARAWSTGQVGAYSLQAAIAAVHASASSAADTDWPQIVILYDALLVVHSSPVVQLNRAVAVAMRDGPAAGLQLIDDIIATGNLREYHLLYAAQADLCRRLGRDSEARAAYQQAVTLARQEPERRFLTQRLHELESASVPIQHSDNRPIGERTASPPEGNQPR